MTNLFQPVCLCGRYIDLQTARKDGYGVYRCEKCLSPIASLRSQLQIAKDALEKIRDRVDRGYWPSKYLTYDLYLSAIASAALKAIDARYKK